MENEEKKEEEILNEKEEILDFTDSVKDNTPSESPTIQSVEEVEVESEAIKTDNVSEPVVETAVVQEESVEPVKDDLVDAVKEEAPSYDNFTSSSETPEKKKKNIVVPIIIVLIIYAAVIAVTIVLSRLYVEEVEKAKIRIYGRYMVVDYEIDEQDYTDIQIIPENKVNNPTERLKIMHYKNNPEEIYIDYSMEIRQVIIIASIFGIIFILIVFFVGKSCDKEIETVKNGMIVEAEVIRNTAGGGLLRWINPEDNKSYYYLFYKGKYERKWIEKIEKVYIVVNKANMKNFYVIGKEML